MNNSELPDIDSVWDYRDPAASETRFQDLLARSDDQADSLEIMTQIARTHSLRDQFEEAHEWLDRVEPELDPGPPRVRVRYLLERGRSFNSAGRKVESMPLFLEAMQIAQREGLDYHAVDAAHMLGIAAPLDEQLTWGRQAMAMAEASDDARTRDWLGPLYNNMGWTMHDSGDYAEALEIFEKSTAFREQKGEEIPIRIARWSVARALRSLGRNEEALAIQFALQKEWQAAGGEDGYVFEELGECLLAVGRSAEAQPYFARAYRLLSEDTWLQDHEPERLSRLRELGHVVGPAGDKPGESG